MTESDELDFLRRSSCWQISASFIAALVLSASLLPAQDQPDIPDLPALIAYYPLSSNALPVAGTNNGIVSGGAVFQDDSVLLNGTDAYISFGSSLSVTGSAASICLWLKSQPETDQQLLRVLGKFQIEGNNRDYCLFLNRGLMVYFFSDNGSSDAGHALVGATLLPAVSTQVWHHVAVTWKSAQGANGVALYCDAVPLAITNLQSSDLRFLHAGQAALTLGTYDLPVTPDPVSPPSLTNAFRGSMCQLALFDGVLTPEDVADIAALGRFEDLRDCFISDGLTIDLTTATAEDGGSGTAAEPSTPSGTNGSPVVLPPSSVLQSGIIYVDKARGNDANSGRASLVLGSDGPKKTVTAGLSAAQSGDTLVIKEGHYAENLNVAGRNVKVIFEGKVNLSARRSRQRS